MNEERSAAINQEIQLRASEQQGYTYLVFPFSVNRQGAAYFRKIGNIRGAAISIPKSLTKNYTKEKHIVYLDGEIDGYKYYTKLLVETWFYEKNKDVLELYKQD